MSVLCYLGCLHEGTFGTAHAILVLITYGPRPDKTCVRGFRESEIQTSITKTLSSNVPLCC